MQRALLSCVSLLQVNSLGVHVALCSVHCCVMCVIVAGEQFRGACCSVQRALLCICVSLLQVNSLGVHVALCAACAVVYMCVLAAGEQFRGACCSVCSVRCCVMCPCCR